MFYTEAYQKAKTQILFFGMWRLFCNPSTSTTFTFSQRGLQLSFPSATPVRHFITKELTRMENKKKFN